MKTLLRYLVSTLAALFRSSRAAVRRALGRVLAAPVAAFVGWLGAGALPASGDEATATMVSALTLAVYGVLHKLVDHFANPEDRA